MLSNQWLTEIAPAILLPCYPPKTDRVTGFPEENQSCNPVTFVTPKNNRGGSRFEISHEQKKENSCCGTCRHGQPATPGDPWSWHSCAIDAERSTGWGKVQRKCGQWETAVKEAEHVLEESSIPRLPIYTYLGKRGIVASATGLVAVTYRTGHQRGGKPRKAILYAADDPQAVLTRLHGEPVTLLTVLACEATAHEPSPPPSPPPEPAHEPSPPPPPSPPELKAVTVMRSIPEPSAEGWITATAAILAAEGWSPTNARARAESDWLWRHGAPTVHGLAKVRAQPQGGNLTGLWPNGFNARQFAPTAEPA